MKLQVTLALICVLFSKALALKCYQCLSGTCTDTQTTCPDQCASGTATANIGGQRQDINVKGCAVASECVSGSLNLGVLKMTMNSKCCSSDLCNSQTTAALPFGSPNGKKCYTCVDKDCTGTVSCEGDEDRCISTTVTSGGVQLKMKGCVSRGFCTAGALIMQTAGITQDVSCCEGDLCNSAEGVKLSLLIMLVPLISSILFL